MSLLSNDNDKGLFRFSGSVGRMGDNDRADVIKAQVLLANAGYLDLPYPGVPTGWAGADLTQAITHLQRDAGLEPDGALLPLGPDGVSDSGVGETMQVLQDRLGERLRDRSAPTPALADAFWAGWRPTRDEDASAVSASVPPIVTAQQQAETGQPQGTILSDVPPPADSFQPWQQVAKGPGSMSPTSPLRGTPAPRVTPTPGPNAPGQRIPGQRAPGSSPQPELRQGPYPGQDLRPPVQPLSPEQQRQLQDWQRESLNPRATFFDRQMPPSAAPQRGRIVIAEDGRELQVPPLGVWADRLDANDRQFAERFYDALAVEMLRFGGGRGKAETQLELNIIAETCTELAKEKLPGFQVEHIAGAHKGGAHTDKDDPLPEERMWMYDERGHRLPAGFRQPDFTIRLARNVVLNLRGNSVDTYRDGVTPTSREQRAADAIRGMAPDEGFAIIGKSRSRATEAEIRAAAEKACGEELDKLVRQLEKDGEWLKPAPQTVPKYSGPANKRRADEIRDGARP